MCVCAASVTVSCDSSIILALSLDPTRDTRPCPGIRAESFVVRRFFAGFEIRVLIELTDEITVWSVTRAPTPS
jgi:hypothetical protein